MFGLIVKLNALAGKRDALMKILVEGTSNMPGCQSYIVAKDSTDHDGIWITEVWNDQQHHRASMTLPAVQRAMAMGKPMIAKFGEPIMTEPIGGYGLVLEGNR